MLYKFGVSASTIERVFEHDPEFAAFMFNSDFGTDILLKRVAHIYLFAKGQGCAWRRRVVTALRTQAVRTIIEEYDDATKHEQNGKKWRQLMFGVTDAGVDQLIQTMRNVLFISIDQCHVLLMMRRGGGGGGGGHGGGGGGGGHGGGGGGGGGGHGGGGHARRVGHGGGHGGGGGGFGGVRRDGGGPMRMPLGERIMQALVEDGATPAAVAEQVSVSVSVSEAEAEGVRKKAGKKRGAGLLSAGPTLAASTAAPEAAVSASVSASTAALEASAA
jgi:hypothetical protein